MTRDMRRYPVLAAWLALHAFELAAYVVARSWHLWRRRPLACWLLGHEREPWPPHWCIRCPAPYEPVREGPKP